MRQRPIYRSVGAVMLASAAVAVCLADRKAPPAENFRSKAWYALEQGGEWEVLSEHEVRQKQGKPYTNNAFNRKVEQSGAMAWSFEIRVPADGGRCGAGMYVLADDEKARDRGNSYLLWYRHHQAKKKPEEAEPAPVKPMAVIGKFVDNKRIKDWRPSFELPTKPGDWVKLRFEYDPAGAKSDGGGRFAVYCNGRKVGQADDPKPITQGNHVSLHTCLTPAGYRNLRIIHKGH